MLTLAADTTPGFDAQADSENAEVRDRLTVEELLASQVAPEGPVPNHYFLPVGEAAVGGALTAVLGASETPMATSPIQVAAAARLFPAFTSVFFVDGDRLVPAARGILRPTGSSSWGIILSPGRVWSEAGDGGWSRGSFPFVLVSTPYNEAHNGIATFLYSPTSVSALRIQVVQETAAWSQFDGWAQIPLRHQAVSVIDDRTRERREEERSREVPVLPWSALEPLYGADAIAGFDGGLSSRDISAAGLLVDGVLYLRPSDTRYGEFPFPRHMRHGAFSVTKSAGAAVALLALTQRHGDSVFDLLVRDYVEVTATHRGWDRVTFLDCLNMATGIGNQSPDPSRADVFADENDARMERWSLAPSAAAKLRIAFEYGNYPWGPGEVVRYNTTHTFILGAAMDAFLKDQDGRDADIWEFVEREVLHPIGILHAPIMRTIESDGSKGLPIMGVGLYLTVDDVAKLATLLQAGGLSDGRRLLSKRVQTALYRTEEHHSLATGINTRSGDPYLYSLSFWSQPTYDGTDCFRQIPYMSGFGGNLVALAPNGVSVFRFADAHVYDPQPLLRVAREIRPLCP